MDFKTGIAVFVVGIMLAGVFGSGMVSASIASWADYALEAKNKIDNAGGIITYSTVAIGLDIKNNDGSTWGFTETCGAVYPWVEVQNGIIGFGTYSGYAGWKGMTSLVSRTKDMSATKSCQVGMYAHAWIKAWDKGAVVQCASW